MRRLFVTGATGHVGGWFIRALAGRGYDGVVVATARAGSDTRGLLQSGLRVEVRMGDLREEAFIADAMRGADAAVSIADLRFSPAVMRAAIAGGTVRRAVLVHTTGVYSRFKAAAAGYKRVEEALADVCAGALQPVILRPTMIYGSLDDHNISRFMRMVDRLPVVPLVGAGRSLLQPVWARDVGEACALALFHEGELLPEYVISGDAPMTVRDTLEALREAIGAGRRLYLPVPEPLALAGAVALRAATLGKVDMVEKVQRMGEDRAFPHDAAARDFGYKPAPFREGVREEARAYVEGKEKGRGTV